jgi:hypothetical protein
MRHILIAGLMLRPSVAPRMVLLAMWSPDFDERHFGLGCLGGSGRCLVGKRLVGGLSGDVGRSRFFGAFLRDGLVRLCFN